jgi:ubiquinone/menaquinone biosynthesis C-methylase UbiE
LGVHNFVLERMSQRRYARAMRAAAAAQPKSALAEFWNAEPCGTRYLKGVGDYDAHRMARYRLEPYIADFAQFSSGKGLRVLEIGVGMGADYERWLRAGAKATGIDLSARSIARAAERCRRAGLNSDLQVADAERLPFADESFDLVYSYGVLHHSPNPATCISETWRVLRPGGSAKIMLYHHPSLTGLMLWIRFGIWRFQSLRSCVFEHLESPGTKTFTRNDVLALMARFEEISIRQVFSPGDLLMHNPSAKFQSFPYRVAWKIFPRRIMQSFGKRLGLFLLIDARKPN